MRSITDWRRRILIHLSSSSVEKFCSEQSFRELFGAKADANIRPALDSLVKDRLIYEYKDSGYTLNPVKQFEIIAIIMQDVLTDPPFKLEHDGEFEDCDYWFDSNGTHKRKSNYLYYRSKSNTNCFKVKIAKAGKKSARLDMGCLDDANSKIGKILTAVKSVDGAPFAKSDIEIKVHHEAGNNRQPIKAAFDILERLGMIRKIDASVRYPKYIRVIQ